MSPYEPFWNDKCNILSQSIWNPTDYVDNLETNKNLYYEEKYHPYLVSQKTVQKLDTNKQEIIITRKVRFYPTQKQKEYLGKCLSAHRYFYNKTIEEINNRFEKRKQEFSAKLTCIFCDNKKFENSYTCEEHKNKSLPWNLAINFNEMRKIVVKNNSILTDDDKWQEEIPHDTRQAAVKNALTSYSSSLTNRIRGNIKNFKLGYMSRKKPTHIFWLDHRAISIKEKKESITVSIFKTKLKSDSELFVKNKYRKQLPLNNTSAVKVLYDRGAWYLVFSLTETTQNKCDNLHSIALDPGVRTFQTGYSPNGNIYKFGEEQLNQMKTIHNKIDLLKSISSKAQNRVSKTRYHIKRRLYKLEFRLRCIVHNLHNQVGSFLSQNYRYILLPEFGTSGMQQQDTIVSTTKRRMNGLAHYQFQMKMVHFCKKYGSELKIVDESYTSKTCGKCGNIKENLGSACHYKCDTCNYSLDRDIHGARNIWIKTYS